MDEIALKKAWSRLAGFHDKLPKGGVKEIYVAEYHDILQNLERETGQTLAEFMIPPQMVEPRPIIKSNRIVAFPNLQTNTSSEPRPRYCDEAFFLMRLQAAINFFSSLIPEEMRRRIGF